MFSQVRSLNCIRCVPSSTNCCDRNFECEPTPDPEPNTDVWARLERVCSESGGKVKFVADPVRVPCCLRRHEVVFVSPTQGVSGRNCKHLSVPAAFAAVGSRRVCGPEMFLKGRVCVCVLCVCVLCVCVCVCLYQRVCLPLSCE